LLFLTFGINYNTLPQLHRKGSTLIREQFNVKKEKYKEKEGSTRKLLDGTELHRVTSTDNVKPATSNINSLFENKTSHDNQIVSSVNERIKVTNKSNKKSGIIVLHDDIINNIFWDNHPYILGKDCTVC
jgi:hypothetical protein